MSDRRGENYPHLAPGHYAVTAPDGRLTFWSVDTSGSLRDYPPRTRWRPTPPPLPPGLPREARRELRARWYDSVYWPYKDGIVAAIGADPARARQRFEVEFPRAELPAAPPRRRRHRPPRPTKPTPAQQRRAAESLAAVALQRAGMSYREIGSVLGLSPMTAHRRVQATETPATVRAALLERAARLHLPLRVNVATSTDPGLRDQARRSIEDIRALVTAILTET